MQNTVERFDTEIKRIVSEQYDRAQQTLTDGKPALIRVAEALLEHEVLDGDQLRAVIDGRPLEIRKPEPVPPPPAPPREVRVDGG